MSLPLYPVHAIANHISVQDISVHEASLYTHLVEILSFFVRQHQYRAKYYILSENLHCRIAQLLSCGQKHLKLTALKWFRICVGLKDEYHNRQLITNNLFEPLLALVYETMPRDNLLNSASLEFFEFMRKENLKQLIVPLVENYREKLLGITYVNIFENLVDKYDQIQNGFEVDEASFSTQGAETPNKGLINGGQRWQGLRDADAEEEAYFNTSDGEEEDEASLPTTATVKPIANGTSPVRPPLVTYPDDDEDAMDVLAASPSAPPVNQENKSPNAADNGSPRSVDRTPTPAGSPPDRLHEKRRREEDDEDDLEKLAGGGAKRRNSISSVRSDLSAANMSESGNGSPKQAPLSGGTPMLRRKGSLKSKDGGPGPQKGISIGSISLSLKDSNAEGGS